MDTGNYQTAKPSWQTSRYLNLKFVQYLILNIRYQQLSRFFPIERLKPISQATQFVPHSCLFSSVEILRQENLLLFVAK